MSGYYAASLIPNRYPAMAPRMPIAAVREPPSLTASNVANVGDEYDTHRSQIERAEAFRHSDEDADERTGPNS